MTKGRYWRSSVRRTVRQVLEQYWGYKEIREVAFLPAGTQLLDDKPIGPIPRVALSWQDKKAYDVDPEALNHVTTRACLELIRQGYEIMENPAPITPRQMRRTTRPPNGNRIGDPKDNGGPIDDDD